MNFEPRKVLVLPVLIALGAVSTVLATTWNEPWHEAVVKEAETFVLLRVVSKDEGRSFKAEVVKHLAGVETPKELTVDHFWALDLTSTSSAADGPQFRFEPGFTGYFFLKKKKDGDGFGIATPTTGFAPLKEGGAKVQATYRHSYHQAMVDTELYEKTQTAIFEFLHGRAADKEFMTKFLDETLKETPQELGKGVDDPEAPARFFRQHVALECGYYFCTEDQAKLLEPFLKAEFFHVQVSAARALSGADVPETRARLAAFVAEPGRNGFAKVMAVWGLARLDAREAAPVLEAFVADGADEETGFGGNIMDPRVGTSFPGSVKAAVKAVLAAWKGAGDGEEEKKEEGK